jgi:broad specificity polyphosphatase/5'/3'-nucleotidase SurE
MRTGQEWRVGDSEREEQHASLDIIVQHTMISSMSLHSPRVERSGLSNVLAISPPVTAASRSMPSKSACSIETTPASVNI